ncbi:competence protein CoiA [Bacillus canaveralius]|uniref:Competence protein CoiA n=1 Tax=Bacillus canaveralius TaxID=1403243 RepID=A0A2N5GKP4_9BACI|nr:MULTISPECIES: competence protein CoiA family protein [Bacillus]PLR81822.1 competence protein CoiA [Bacillus sp. V33-4]PLR82039.1 competence protein CoiA [Bacillus canaveralius]PLR99425.1 competence protein CoiA [Bacillus canaveralius]
MLTAKTKTGEYFSLGDHYRYEFLDDLRKREEFYCPHCDEKLILKIGTKKVHHFSHYHDSICTAAGAEAESLYHMEGKLNLYSWLKRQNLQPILEHYIPEINQRADISYTYKGKRIALEYQCSPISSKQFIDRTNGYLRFNWIPIWILGGKLLKRKTADIASFSQFHFLFFRQHIEKWNLLCYCPVTNQFITIHHPISMSPRHAFVQFSFSTPTKTDIQQLLTATSSPSFSLNAWRKELDRYKLTFFGRTKSANLSFLKEIYRHSLNISLLPSIIGLPTANSLFIETSPLIWQTYLYMDVLQKYRSGEVLSIQQLYHCFSQRLKKNQINIRSLPLVKGSWPLAVQGYVKLLVDTGYLAWRNKNNLAVLKQIIRPETSAQKSTADELMYRNFGPAIMRNL